MFSFGRAFSNCVSNPVSVVAARSSKLPAPSLYPGSTETLLGFFFSRYWLAGQSQVRSDTVELTHTDCQGKTLLKSALHRRAGDARVDLAVLNHKGKHFPTQNVRVPMPSIGQSSFSFALHATGASDRPLSGA